MTSDERQYFSHESRKRSYPPKSHTFIETLPFFNLLKLKPIVGLSNAGKSTVTSTMASGQYDEDSIPTIGFNFRRLKKGNVSMNVWDLGGQDRFRDSWEKYCRSSDVIVYVVDSVDLGAMDEAR